MAEGGWMAGVRPREALGLLLVALWLVGCDGADQRGADRLAEPVALVDQEDEVCGMLVREQSAPRSQIVHSDGSRFFFCSIGDMLVHLGAPSPHGRAAAIFVEVMDPEEDPSLQHTDVHPWAAVEDALYVVGVERRGIMGAPVLTYASRSDAELVQERHDGSKILDADELRVWWSAHEAAR